MAWGRKKSGGRREPQFGLAASLSELRLGPQDRVSANDETPKKPSPKRKASDTDNDAPRERKPRANRGGSKRRSKGRARSGLYRLFFWGGVLGLWAGAPPGGVSALASPPSPACSHLSNPQH